jgi:hypothetical protein
METVALVADFNSINRQAPNNNLRPSLATLSTLPFREVKEVMLQNNGDSHYTLPIVFNLVLRDDISEDEEYWLTKWVSDTCLEASKNPDEAKKIFDCCWQARDGSRLASGLVNYLIDKKIVGADYVEEIKNRALNG